MGPDRGIRYTSVAKWMVALICFISLDLISTAEVHERNSREDRRRTETDPVSTFFSELGNLFLDIDETIAVRTAPKVELEGFVAQLLRPSDEHFNSVQDNYKTLQRRLGSFVRQSLTPKSSYTDRDLSTVTPPNNGEEIEQDLSSTHAPAVKSNAVKIPLEKHDPSPSTDSLNDDTEAECSIEILNNPLVESTKRKDCSQRLRRHAHPDGRLKKGRSKGRKGVETRTEKQPHIPLNPDEHDSYQYGFSRRGGEIAQTTEKPQGRILGDVLYSESLFDRSLRQLLRDHGRWILDNPLLTRWRKATSKDSSEVAMDTSTAETEVGTKSYSTPEIESTQVYIPVTPEYNVAIPVSEETDLEDRFPLKSASYYRLMDNDGITGEEVEIVLNQDSNLETVHVDELKKIEPEGSVILAFTSDGVPIKLRIGPEIENPTRFLHKVLQSAGVSLNVPVESYDDLKPAGKEVLKFGTGILIRPNYYDLSNKDDLKSLLRTLIKSKASGKSK